MSNLKVLQQQYEEGLSLKTITSGYSEISASKLQKIRGTMEANISFAKELAEVFQQIRREAAKRGVKQTPKIKEVVHILITSNNRFYGNLERPLAHYFQTATQNASPDLIGGGIRIVVGKTGATFLIASRYPLDYQPLIFRADLPTSDELKTIINLVKTYQTVLVYHSRFKTVLTQIPVISDVSESVTQPTSENIPIKYIFEPEIGKILEFFETQILQIFIEQTFLESELARTAARLTAMDTAETNANDYLKALNKTLASAKKTELDAKSLETVNALVEANKATPGIT